MTKTVSIKPCLLLASSLALGCSSREIDLGGGRLQSDLRTRSRCAESPRLEGDVRVRTQADLEALAGCEEIGGELRIETFEGADLAPLASLRVVGSALELGADPLEFPEDPDEAAAFWEGIAAIRAAGYLPSLAGLAALQSAQVLYLTGSSVANLTELESLVELEATVIRDMQNLENLEGLENVLLSYIWVSVAPALTSLDGLTLDSQVDTLIFERLPALKNIDALASVQSATSSLMLYDTGIEALPELGLEYVAGLNIEANPGLTNIDSLAGLLAVDTLVISNNASLRGLPAFDDLSTLDTLRIVDNDALTELDLSFPALELRSNSIADRNIEIGATLVEINQNANLVRIASLGFTSIEYFSIYQNSRLREVNLADLRRADLLIIEQNPELVSLSAPSLANVDSLQVVDNSALDAAVFDGVESFERTVSGNAVIEP